MGSREPSHERRGILAGLLRDPLLHFFLIGLAIFGAFALLDDSPRPVAPNALVITEDDARRLVAAFEATWRRSPTVEELDYMIGERVREEVYVREAMALGLDRDDEVIRRRLQTKMEFLTESGAEAVAPDDTTLGAHLAANAGRFSLPALVAFEQVLLAEGVADDEAAAIAARLDAGGDPGASVRPTLLPPEIMLSPPPVVDGIFGTGFFDAVAAVSEGRWTGPVASALGRHLVRVTERRDARTPQLAEVREQVERDWRATLAAELREASYGALLARYEVVTPDPAQVLAP
jgi:hypothetical protein